MGRAGAAVNCGCEPATNGPWTGGSRARQVPPASVAGTSSGLHHTHPRPTQCDHALDPLTAAHWRGTRRMAQTDARPGFRLPWSSDRQTSDPSESATDSEPQPDNATAWPNESNGSTPEVALATADAPVEPASPVVDPWVGSAPTPEAPKAPSGKKPSKFLADLTKAMQTAAEDARSRAVTQLQADAKTHVEAIHGRSSTEAASLRRAADDDVATVREWSKAEIARIREETETKITARKSKLERQIEEHAGFIEREIDAVQKTVASFEAEMAAFFERLLAEEDPSRFAT